jgi:hypothetical protein
MAVRPQLILIRLAATGIALTATVNVAMASKYIGQ